LYSSIASGLSLIIIVIRCMAEPPRHRQSSTMTPKRVDCGERLRLLQSGNITE
jgi:hypothetical protein